ncbi:MAG: hypothetical protein CMN30_05615 [Sandaracinus sp.]|nr:hypothetical protein [Sandaracinus sp.]|tara:strand:+ start:3305 stop:3769 length:465 start_codon:yes stop_codon:yes gene_type:complete
MSSEAAGPLPTHAPERGNLASRFTWFVLMAIPLAVIITATTITPDPAGHGTHMQLGLPPCGFLVATGLPCPGCGLTTSFSHMVRLQFAGAAHANPFGVALFLVTFFTIPVAAVGLVRGLPVLATLERLHFEKVIVLLAACSSVVWLIRIGTALL